MKTLILISLVLLLSACDRGEQNASHFTASTSVEYSVFQNPPLECRCFAMCSYDLAEVDEAYTIADVRKMAEYGFGGFFFWVKGADGSGLDPQFFEQSKKFYRFRSPSIEFNGPEFFGLLRSALDEAKKHGMQMIFYDDYFFPAGQVAGQFYQQYPQHMTKRLDMLEKEVTGPAKVSLSIPADSSIYMGAVMMRRDNFERIDISDGMQEDFNFEYSVPEGDWKVMIFYINTQAVLGIRNPGTIDYLDEAAVSKYIELTYEKTYENLKEYFGTDIPMAFYDEPTMHWMLGRMWTASFNAKFREKYGFSPITYYPAMWYDIGSETAEARNALFGLQAQLFSEAFVKQIQEWCAAHNILSSGHMDQEEIVNPIPVNGDLMKIFEYQDIPGADDIWDWGRTNKAYKIVTSASFNYDKPITMTETFAAYHVLTENTLFQGTMDQYVRGVNMQIPENTIFKHESRIRELNNYVGRLSYLLRHGRHVSDIAVLYPINSLNTDFVLGEGWDYAYEGGVPSPELDYINIGQTLFDELRIDYTFLHPEVLDNRCTIDQDRIILNNKENREEYKILIIPGGTTISSTNAKKALEYYENGGAVIFTTQIPYQSSEAGLSGEVQQVMSKILNTPINESMKGKISVDDASGYIQSSNSNGGMAFYIPKPAFGNLGTVIRAVIPVLDVDIRREIEPLKTGKAYDGELCYLHKVKKGRDIYFFANSSGRTVETDVILRGNKNLEIWNPHSGEKSAAHVEGKKAGSEDVTSIRLTLPPVTSIFYIGE